MKNSYPKRSPDIVMRKETKEALLFNPQDGNILCVNATGAFIWDLCSGNRSKADITEEIIEKYDVSKEKAQEDCQKFLKDMEEAGFIGYTV